jgi:hypothetical protein
MRRLAYTGTILLLVVSIAGFITSLILNAFVFTDQNAYGAVPVPGQGTVHLPAGQVTISFNTQVIGSPSGGGLPLPDLGLTIVPPDGVAEPPVTENIGGTTTINNDSYRQVWVTQIAEEGDYVVKTDGQVNGYIRPQLTFGHGSSMGYLTWVFVGIFVFALLALFALIFTGGRKRKIQPQYAISLDHYAPNTEYVPSDEGIRVQQLKTLTDLHSSGALTDAEFETEKKRILDG